MLFIKTLVTLISATAVLAQGTANAVASGAILIGKDATENPVTPLSMFQNRVNHITALSSVLAFSAELANFEPAESPAKSLVSSLDLFVQKISTFPGFVNSGFLDRSIALNGSFTQMEKAIREADDSITHLPLIARNIRDLTPGFIQDKSLKKWILSLVLLEQPSDSSDVRFKLARLVLTLSTDATNTVYIPEQSARLTIADYHVNGGSLVVNADRLSQMIPTVVSPRDVIDLLTSPKVTENIAARGWEFLKEKYRKVESHDWQLVFNWKK